MLSFETFLTRGDLITVLNRHINVRVLEISATGCLLESDSEVPVGTVGSLSLRADDGEYADPIQVTRAQRMPGSCRHLLGAEFVWLTLPGSRSIRRLARNVGGLPRPCASDPESSI